MVTWMCSSAFADDKIRWYENLSPQVAAGMQDSTLNSTNSTVVPRSSRPRSIKPANPQTWQQGRLERRRIVRCSWTSWQPWQTGITLRGTLRCPCSRRGVSCNQGHDSFVGSRPPVAKYSQLPQQKHLVAAACSPAAPECSSYDGFGTSVGFDLRIAPSIDTGVEIVSAAAGRSTSDSRPAGELTMSLSSTREPTTPSLSCRGSPRIAIT